MEFILKREGFTVTVARAGEESLAAIRAQCADLVILDVMMPKLDGYTVLQAVRADPQLAAIRILVLTAKSREAEQKKGLLLGADAYMPKPFSTHDLIANVRRLLSTDAATAPTGN